MADIPIEVEWAFPCAVLSGTQGRARRRGPRPSHSLLNLGLPRLQALQEVHPKQHMIMAWQGSIMANKLFAESGRSPGRPITVAVVKEVRCSCLGGGLLASAMQKGLHASQYEAWDQQREARHAGVHCYSSGQCMGCA